MIEHIRQPFSVLLHPFDQTEGIRSQKRHSVYAATGILFFFFLSEIVDYLYTGRAFNFNKPGTLNVLLIVLRTLLPFLLFVIANWCTTTLMEGKGGFTQIYVFSAYALLPMTLAKYLVVLMSNVLSSDEISFLLLISGFGILWSAFLLVVSLMTLHQYTFLKTFLSFIATVVGMAIIAFLLILFFSLIQEMVNFFNTIYFEIYFRF
jgi:hypothetical protein